MMRWKDVFERSREAVDRAVGREAQQPVRELAQEHAELLRFYRTLSAEIASHRDYESHVSGGVDRDSPFVKRFDPDEYAARLSEHFRASGLIAPLTTNGSYYALLMTFLFPDEDIRSRLGWGLRRKEISHLLDQWLKRLRVRSRRQVKSVVLPGKTIAAVTSMLLFFVATVASLALADQIAALTIRLSPSIDPLTASLLPRALTLLSALMMAGAAFRIGSHRAGRMMRSTVDVWTRTGLTTKDSVSAYFRRRFDVKWPKSG